MDAFTHHRDPAPSFSPPQWDRCRVRSFAPIDRAEAPASRRDQCPRCFATAAAPIVSTYQSGGVIAHQWQCECCDAEWATSFQPLLV
jgi:hypothetical protein